MSEQTQERVLIIGAGPIGMIAGLEIARYGVPVVILDDDDKFADGSRAIAMHASLLEVFERNGCLQPVLDKGVVWHIRRTFYRDQQVFLQQMPLPKAGQLPIFLNLQQSYTEEYLYQRICGEPLITLHWKHRVVGLEQDADAVTLTVETPQGVTTFRGAYVLACDGAKSPTRKMLGLDFPGHSHDDSFLIVDIRADLPFERQPRFFFDHPTNPGSTILIHPQPDGVWRIDWQVGAHIDIEAEKAPEKIDQRVRALIGDTSYEVVWLSAYRFHQRLLEKFQHGRVLFAGDSAHLVAPFGARGMNSGVLDAENLAWKLGLVMSGQADAALLETYDDERWPAQKENQVVTDTTMRFMVPPNGWHRLRRKIVLGLSKNFKSARRWVDSGKMAVPFHYADSSLNLPDTDPHDAWQDAPQPGARTPDPRCMILSGDNDPPLRLRHLLGETFLGLLFAPRTGDPIALIQAVQESTRGLPFTLAVVVPADMIEKLTHAATNRDGVIWLLDDGQMAAEFAARPGSFYLLRPDRHLAARRRNLTPEKMHSLAEKVKQVYWLKV
ncbi:FAD-dependent monooxygenase [bacterium]|nr:FAD-dependent monooxygenase [bacterium]MCB2179110.1 FAD-dependent monooxygenase [bacterium]